MLDTTNAAQRIGQIIEGSRMNVSTEAAAHAAVVAALRAHGVECETEVILGAGERIDVLAGAVGIEVKVKGSRRDIFRQLQRYAAHDRIEALVLATGTPWPKAMMEVDGKPFFLASLHKGWL